MTAPRDPYAYEDFRQLLVHLFADLQAADPTLSHRKFATQAGFSNPGFLGDVIKGRRKLSEEAQEKMIRGMGLQGGEADWFRLLVAFGQAKETTERDELYRQMRFRRSRSSFAKVHPALARYYQDHRYPLVRAAIEVVDFRGDFALLGEYLDPPLPATAVRKLVGDLVEWGLVAKLPDQRYRVTSKFVEPAPTLREQVRHLNRTWLKHSEEALLNLPPEKRHISTMLLNISEAKHREILERIEAFRQELFALANSEEKPTRTMQLSLAYFARSRTAHPSAAEAPHA